MATKSLPYKPWHPATYEKGDAVAMQALLRGDATKDQQKRALDWIIGQAARTHDMTYFSESDRDSAFAEGKRFVGNQIIKMLKLNTMHITKKEQTHG